VRANVSIKAYERGKLIASREGHNVWVTRGRQYLAEMVTYQDMVPTPERSDRLRFMGLGIGGAQQNRSDLADAAPLSVSYPVGFDPNATNGHEYRKAYPIDPPVTTLERPVRITGGANPYASAAPTDEWLLDEGSIFFTHMSLYEVTVHGLIEGSSHIAYGTFTQVPLSEVALFTDEVTVGKTLPYSTLVGYFSFDTFLFSSSVDLEMVWRVRFA